MNKLPEGVAKSTRVCAITSFRPHRECLLGGDADGASTSYDRGCASSSIGTHPVSETVDSASGRIRLPNGRSFTSTQLADVLRPDFELHNRRWKMQDVRERLLRIDPGAAVTIAGLVLHKLKRVHMLDKQTSSKLIQGLAVCLRRRGFGVALHTALAGSVREQALELARKKYYGEARKRGLQRLQRFSRQTVGCALDSIVETTVGPGGDRIGVEYIVGWTGIPPPQMGDGHANFPPVDALDCASMRGRAQGILVGRGKKDGDDKIHACTLSHMLAAEGDLSVGAHLAAEKALLPPDAYNTKDYVTAIDGGISLRCQTLQYNPHANLLRCGRHLTDELAKGTKAAKDSVDDFKKLQHIPKGHTKTADRIYDRLPADSPLRRMPKQELAPVYLPEVMRCYE